MPRDAVIPIAERGVKQRRHLSVDVWTLACERAASIFDTFDHVAVSFSGGKDSTATLQVALHVAASDPRFERHLPMRTIFYDEEAVPFETEHYVRRMAQRDDVAIDWLCLPVQHRNACSRKSPYWWPWAPEAEALWVRPLPPEGVTAWAGFPRDPPERRLTIPDANGLLFGPEGNCAMLMGIRAQESLIRANAVARRRTDNYIIRYTGMTSRGNLWKVYPVYDWTNNDVWTAPAKFGWDYNAGYDRQEMAGRGIAAQRCSPPFGEEPLQQLHTYATCFPDIWDKMVDRVPGAAAAGRYALTELYAFRGKPPKPPQMSWPQFIIHHLASHPDKTRPMIASRIAQEIRSHYAKTSDPILPEVRHPQTGCDWNFLLMLTMRGDFKGRRQASHRSTLEADGRRPAGDWRKYADELARCLSEGVTAAELGHPQSLPADPELLIPEYAR
jgi:predicted phosphoadenosine phosphosulfate sulfurtransferase